jgi:hypothetical protein
LWVCCPDGGPRNSDGRVANPALLIRFLRSKTEATKLSFIVMGGTPCAARDFCVSLGTRKPRIIAAISGPWLSSAKCPASRRMTFCIWNIPSECFGGATAPRSGVRLRA